MRYARELTTVVAALASALAIGAEPVEIPLDTIWALMMPGTRDVQKLDPRVNAEETMITKMGRALLAPEKRPKAGPCFVVKGQDKEALANAVKVLVEGKKPIDPVPAGENVSLVFYSHPAPGYVFLDSVRRSPGHLTLEYKVMMHQTADITTHFALIPLGKLGPGKFAVDIVEVNGDGAKYDPKQAERAVCDPCSFVVREQEAP